MYRSAIAPVVALLCAFCLNAQTPALQTATASKPSTPTLRLNTEEVSLDMVFRDKKGRPVTDIKPEEVHVYENGTEEHVNSFRYVQGGEMPAAQGSASAPLTLDPMKQLRLVTLVFENMDLDNQRFFRQALDDIVKMAPQQNLYFSVMVIDQKLNMIQPFTNDRKALLKAVDKSMGWTTIQYWNSSAAIKEELRQSLTHGESGGQSNATGDASIAPTITAPGGAAPSQGAISDTVNFQLEKTEYDMLSQADAADREAGARGTIDGLLALIKSEANLPGRKVVLYFNPWLNIPDLIKEQYSYMISAANRANISFYTVDPKGLVTWDQSGGGVGQMSEAMGEVRGQQMSHGAGEVSTSQSRAEENAENGIRSNPLLWLQDLARQTGGVAIGDTNDLKAPLRTVMQEIESYYEATYNPHITTFDGKFRAISVKIDRPGVDVHTRSGYFALPQNTSVGPQLVAYEVPLMKAIGDATPETGVSFDLGAEKFSERGPKVEYELTMETPLKGITFAPDPDGKNTSIDVTELAVVKDSTGAIVAKFSNEIDRKGLAAGYVGRFQEGNLLQNFRTELAPGNYTVEAAVMDRKGNKLGVKSVPLTVPEPTNKLAVSDVVIVHDNQALKNNAIIDPFYYQGGKVVPTLSRTLAGGPGKFLPFYFSVYPDASIKDAPKLTMGFYKDGQFLGSAEAPLPPAQDGRIPYIAALPADRFTPGSYEIKLDIAQGSASAEQKVDFQVK